MPIFSGVNFIIRKAVCVVVLFAFLLDAFIPPLQLVYAAEAFFLPQPGVRLDLSPAFTQPLLKGVKVYPDNPFRLDFILDKGESEASVQDLKAESARLIRYFLAAVTVPETDLWVNLSPYEQDRIITEAFGITEMGRDLLAQDYVLKQIASSLFYPEEKIGKEFWDEVYAEARRKFGSVDVPVDTFNKVWIVPEKAVVYENKSAAYVVEGRMKVLLEEDYLALDKNADVSQSAASSGQINTLGAEIVRKVLIPVLEKEINEGKNFAQLRQIYHSLVLALWYKDRIKESLLGQVYVDQEKTVGIDIDDRAVKEKIWAQYLEAFRKGAYNYIKEDYDPSTEKVVVRKYFSGGAGLNRIREVYGKIKDRGQLPEGVSDRAVVVESNFLTIDAAQGTFLEWSEIGSDVVLFEERLAKEADALGYEVTEKTKFILHIGNKVRPADPTAEKSKYYLIFNRALQSIGSNLLFLPVNTKESELDQVYHLGEQSSKVAGFNVTSPHKEIIYDKLRDDELTQTAKAAKSVNGYVKLGGDRHLGLTSDGEGWVYWYTRYLGRSLAGKKIVILGSGGATRSVANAIFNNAPDARIVLTDLDPEVARGLEQDILETGQPWHILAVGMADINGAIESADIVLNFTGSGKTYDEHGAAVPDIDYSLLKGKEAIDANYRFKYPGAKNEFLKRAEAAKAEIYNGLGFLIGTIPSLFEAFTGEEVDFDNLMAFARGSGDLRLQEAGPVVLAREVKPGLVASIWPVDMSSVRPYVVVDESLDGTFLLDRVTNTLFDKDGEKIPFDQQRSQVAFVDREQEGRKSLLGEFQRLHPDLELVGVTSNENIFYNKPIVTVIRDQKGRYRIFHALNEEIKQGVNYPMYVVRSNGAGIEEHVSFRLDESGAYVSVFINGIEVKEDDNIQWATGIQPILNEQGFIAPDGNNGYDRLYDDPKHLFVMPKISIPDYMSGGVFFMADQLLLPGRINRYFQDPDQPQDFDLSYSITDDDGRSIKLPLDQERLEPLLKDMGYRAGPGSPHKTKEPLYWFREDGMGRKYLSLRLQENGYPFHIVAETKDHQILEIVMRGETIDGYGKGGSTIRETAEWLREQGVLKAGILDQGKTLRLTVGSKSFVKQTLEPEGMQRAASIIVYARTKDRSKGLKDSTLVNVEGLDDLLKLDPETGKIFYADRSKALRLKIPVYAVRHAQSVAQTLAGTLHGSSADEIDRLSAFGEQQAYRAAPDIYEQMHSKGLFDRDVLVLTSQLLRSQQTAEPFLQYVNSRTGRSLAVETTSLINELNVGVQGYVPVDQLTAEMIRVRDEVRNFNANIRLPGGESYIDLLRRAKAFIDHVNGHYEGKELIIFTHSLFMTALRIVQGIGDWETQDGSIAWNKNKPENTGLWAFESSLSVDSAQKSQEEKARSLGFQVIDQESGHIKYGNHFQSFDLGDTELVVVPHGLTDGDVEGVLQVSKDVDDPRFELNAEGQRQVEEGAKVIWQQYADIIRGGQAAFYRSGTKRTAQTAEAFLKYVGSLAPGLLEDVRVSDAIRMNLGSWEGTTKAQIDSVLSPDERVRAKQFIKKNALIGPKNGQSFVDYLVTVKEFLDSIKEKHPGQTVIVFGHGIFIKAVKVLLQTNDVIDNPYLDWDSGARSSYKLGMPLVMNKIPRRGQGVHNGITAWRKEKSGLHSVEELAAYAANARLEGLRIWRQYKGPLAGAMSPVDLYTALFMDYVDREKFVSGHPQRLRIVPKGSAGSTFYSVAAFAGLIDPDRVLDLDKDDLEIVPTRFGLSDASLYKIGTSFEQGIGLALAGKIKQMEYPVIVFLTDGGLQIGVDHQAKFAAHMGLNNLTVVVDINRLQNAYRVEDVDPTLSLDANGHLSRLIALWEAYGWDVTEIDGHDFRQIRAAYDKIGQGQRPLVILAKTTKGRGMTEIEGQLNFSHKFPSEDDYRHALTALQGTVDEYREQGYDIKYPVWTPVQRMAIDNQGLALPNSDLAIDQDPMQFEKPLTEQGKLYLEKFLKSWLKEFVSINPNQVLIINTDNPSPFELSTPVRSSTSDSPFIFAGINERFALNLAGGMSLEGLAPIYIGPAAHMPVNAEDWKLLGLGKQNVLVIARSSGSALSYWGPGHLVYEDIELFKNPWCQVLQPAHVQDLLLILENYYYAYPQGKPTYLRMQEVSPFDLPASLFDTVDKRKRIFQDGFYLADAYEGSTQPVVFIVSGKTVKEALDAGKKLREAGLSYKIINVLNLSSVNGSLLKSSVAGAVKIVTAIDALPQSLSSLVYDALPEQRSIVAAFGVSDGGSANPEDEIFSENKIDAQSLASFAVKETVLRDMVNKYLSALSESEEAVLVRDSWDQALTDLDNGVMRNLVKVYLQVGPDITARLVRSMVGLAEDVADPWSANYLISDIVSLFGVKLLGDNIPGLRMLVRDHEIRRISLSSRSLSGDFTRLSNDMSLFELREAVRHFKSEQKAAVLSRNGYREVARNVQDRNIRFMKELIPLLISRIWGEIGVSLSSKALLFFNDIKTAASDLDLVYVGPEQEMVDRRLTELCNLLGIKRDLSAVTLINQALKENRGKAFSGYQYGGNIEPVSINGADFGDFYQSQLSLENPVSARKMYEDRLRSDLLKRWDDDVVQGRFRIENLKSVYGAAVNDVLKALVLKFGLSYGTYGDKFWSQLALYLASDEIAFLRDIYELINQARSLSQYVTERRWDVADERVADIVTYLMTGQGVRNYQQAVLNAKPKIDALMQKYLNDTVSVTADRYQGRADKNWDAIANLYFLIIKDRMGDSAQSVITPGGIALTRDRMNIETYYYAADDGLNFNPDLSRKLQEVSGLTPEIIGIHPMTISVPTFLGLGDTVPR